MEKNKCLICDSNENSLFESVSDRFNAFQSYKIVKCTCGFIFLNPRPDFSEIKNHYSENSSYIPHNSLKFNLFNVVYRFVQNFFWYL